VVGNHSAGYVGATLSSVMWHLYKDGDEWKAEKVIEVEGKELQGWDFPVPGFISDLVISMDDRWLYFSNWLHGDSRSPQASFGYADGPSTRAATPTNNGRCMAAPVLTISWDNRSARLSISSSSAVATSNFSTIGSRLRNVLAMYAYAGESAPPSTRPITSAKCGVNPAAVNQERSLSPGSGSIPARM
jgi:hypothetical protein